MLVSFKHDHYIPILRWKEGERGALTQLYESAREHITPLVELVFDSFLQTNLKKESRLY